MTRRFYRYVIFLTVCTSLAVGEQVKRIGSVQSLPSLVRFASFHTAKRGWVLDWSGTLWSTSNAGLRWQALSIPDPRNNDYYIGGIQLLEQQVGWLLQGGILYKTTDDGITWKEIIVPEASESSSIDAAAMSANQLEITVAYHSEISYPRLEARSARGLHIINEGYLYPRIIQSHDGGKTWTREAVPPYADLILSRLAIDTEGRGYALSDTQILIRNPSIEKWVDSSPPDECKGQSWYTADTQFDPGSISTTETADAAIGYRSGKLLLLTRGIVQACRHVVNVGQPGLATLEQVAWMGREDLLIRTHSGNVAIMDRNLQVRKILHIPDHIMAIARATADDAILVGSKSVWQVSSRDLE